MPTFSPLLPFGLPATRDASLRPMGEGRPAGRHISEITHHMWKAAGGNTEPIEGEAEWLRAQTGFLWEMALEYVAKGARYYDAIGLAWKELHQATRPVDKQIRLELDGIHLTPDGYHREDRMLEEYKWTWLSANKWGALPGPPGYADVRAAELLENGKSNEHREHGNPLYSDADLEKHLAKGPDPERYFGEWIYRSAAYLKALNEQNRCKNPDCDAVGEYTPHTTGGVFSTRFIIFWVNGDYSYKKGRGPQATECIVTYTPEELDTNWETVLSYKRWLQEEESKHE